MINVENHLGAIVITNEYITSLIGNTVTNCFGVVKMNSHGPKQGIRSAFRKKVDVDRGVIVRQYKDKIIIDLHITVSYGVNISAVVDNIVDKVRYAVEDEGCLRVHKVNVFIDGMMS